MKGETKQDLGIIAGLLALGASIFAFTQGHEIYGGGLIFVILMMFFFVDFGGDE